MYFPFLRGKQFELIALRELVAKDLLNSKIIPIIEPVKMSSTLIKTMKVFADLGRELAIVYNPKVGNFKADLKTDKNKQLKEKFVELIKTKNITVAHYLNKNSEKLISELSGKKVQAKDTIVICEKKDHISVYEKFFNKLKPKFILVPEGNAFRRRIRGNRVMLDDKFEKQKRNTDYAAMEDESFSDDHLFYEEEGYVGFSDYSIIGSEYSETGFAPYAVAIHIVYLDEEKNLRVKHFVSDTNDDINDPAGKFGEAVTKLAKWDEVKKNDTYGVNEFVSMYKNGKYPGLGTVKKLSLMHHIELVGRILDADDKSTPSSSYSLKFRKGME